MELIYQRLTPNAAETLWRDYGRALGRGPLHAAYGPSWPRPVAVGEFVWRVVARMTDRPECSPTMTLEAFEGETVAWISLRRDPVSPWAYYATGVWPAHQGRGLSRQLRAWAMAMVDKWTDVNGIVIEVLDTNPAWQKARIAETEVPGARLRRGGRIDIDGAEAEIFWLPKGATCK